MAVGVPAATGELLTKTSVVLVLLLYPLAVVQLTVPVPPEIFSTCAVTALGNVATLIDGPVDL